MTIKYSEGTLVEAMILSRTNESMRVAVKDGDDAVSLNFASGTWISEDRGPVEIQFEWERHVQKQPPSEADCICPKEQAARLIQLLFGGDEAGNGDRETSVYSAVTTLPDLDQRRPPRRPSPRLYTAFMTSRHVVAGP